MKQAITPAYTFAPAQRTLDLSAISGFSIRKLYGVANVTRASFLYLVGVTGLGYTDLTGAVLTLVVDTTGMAAGDDLVILYEVASSPILSTTIANNVQALAPGAPYVLPANPTRKALRWMVTGPGAVRVLPGTLPAGATSVPANGGMLYAGAQAAEGQGGSETFAGLSAPTNAFTFTAIAATSITIWEEQ